MKHLTHIFLILGLFWQTLWQIQVFFFEQFVKPTQSKMLRFKLVPYSKVLNLLMQQQQEQSSCIVALLDKITPSQR